MHALRMRRALLASAAVPVLLIAAGANAGNVTSIDRLTGWGEAPANVVASPTIGSTYAVYTGVATSTGSLALLESSTAPVAFDDVVIFDGASERINDYIAAAGSIQRFVTESDVDNGNGTRTLTVTVTGLTPAGAPGDLWPSGFSSGGTALTSGAFGIGVNLPDTLDNSATADGLNWDAASAIQSASLAIATDGVYAAPLAIPATLFAAGGTYPLTGWNGILGLSLGNGATGTAVQDGLRFSVTYTPIPEPTAVAVLALGAGAVLRRRRA